MRSRTSNLLIRSQMLYPIELWLRKRFGTKAQKGAAVNGFAHSVLDEPRHGGNDYDSILSRVTEGLAR